MFSDVVDLFKSYGPSMAGWVLLFVFFAWVAGKGGVLAMRNIKSLLDAGEDLRARQKKSLDDCEEQIQERDAMIKVLRQDIETARLSLAHMHKEFLAAELSISRLISELEAARNIRRVGDTKQ